MASIETRRLLFAPAERVFAALTTPAEVERWFVPGEGLQCAPGRPVQMDARNGGAYRIAVRALDGPELVLSGVFTDVRAPDALDFAWNFGGGASRVSLRLERRGPHCELVLLHDELAADRVGETEGIWASLLRHLEAHVGSTVERFAAHFRTARGFRSRFGGFWTDRDDAPARIDEQEGLGRVSRDDAAALRTWMSRGFVRFEGAVAPRAVDRLLADIDRAWETPRSDLYVEHYADERLNYSPIAPELRSRPHKLLDFHAFSTAAQDAIFCAPVMRFLGQLFERPPLAFQSLTFNQGSEQDMHQDTAFVALRSPMEFVGCWIALEDVRKGSGELQYFEGSQRIDEYLFGGLCRAMPPGVIDQRPYLDSLQQQCRAKGLPLVRHAARRGDVLLWHADLVHGGAPIEDPAATRRSFVVHLCPLDNEPAWFAWTQHSGNVQHTSGGWTCYTRRG